MTATNPGHQLEGCGNCCRYGWHTAEKCPSDADAPGVALPAGAEHCSDWEHDGRSPARITLLESAREDLTVRIAYSLALLGTTITLVAGCGGTNGNSASVGPNAASEGSAPTSGAVAVPRQLNFTAITVDGSEFSGTTLVGKPAVLWFWAPWCPTCQREAPDVANTARANPAVRFVGVAALDQVPAMQEFVDKYGIGIFTNIADVDGAVWQHFGVTAQPAFAFVSADGSVDVVRGALSEPELSARISTLKSP